MATLSQSEKQELLEDAASELRMNAFAKLSCNLAIPTPQQHLAFLTFASTVFQESARDRPLPIETTMLM